MQLTTWNRFLHIPLSLLWALVAQVQLSYAWISYADTGTATMTHYDLPLDYLAACGCTEKSTHYPTAAMSQMAFGSSTAFGPSCGKCFKLGLLNTYVASPPFILSDDEKAKKQLVVKVTDLCPMTGNGWCSATESEPNQGGQYINFDLAFPSTSIPDDFFPSNESFYGFKDFGIWNVSYTAVSCSEWAGHSDSSALGSVSTMGPESVCCPADPYTNSSSVCPSYSDHNGIAPDTTTSSATGLKASFLPWLILVIPLLLQAA